MCNERKEAIKMNKGIAQETNSLQENKNRYLIEDMIKEIMDSESRNLISILEVSDTDILTDDYDEDRKINYHIAPIEQNWLKERFLWCSGTEKYKSQYEKPLIDLLQKIDPAMLINLNRIVIIENESDIEDVCSAVGADEMEWPSIVDFTENGVIGCHWYCQNCIIICTGMIRSMLKEMKNEYEYFDNCSEEWIAIATTVLHEIRHLGLSNPHLDERLYPVILESEENVEQWALEQFEMLY